jgi:hypothetical protein
VTPEEHYAALVESFGGEPGVTFSSDAGASGRSFGSDALKVDNKIFALLSSKRRFVVKLPRQRVDALVSAGEGERFDPGHGRLMKEWLSVNPGSEDHWRALAKEAKEFVGRSP